MNAAAKMIHQPNIFDGQFSDLRLSKQFFILLVLLISILASAFVVIYVTNNHRSMLNKIEQSEQVKYHMEMQWSQLLLEKASLTRSFRVQQWAYEELDMLFPSTKETLIIHFP